MADNFTKSPSISRLKISDGENYDGEMRMEKKQKNILKESSEKFKFFSEEKKEIRETKTKE